MPHSQMQLINAIRESWTQETCAVPEEWTPENSARGQCDVSSFVFWEHCGGSLVLAEVHRNGEQTEHHYWNRIDGKDIDLTLDQFVNGEELKEKTVLASDYVAHKIPTMRPELQQRIRILRESVADRLQS